ncbi:MAG: bifunctional folylpolyglutamate synthase/dihydrofolate synthase [Planctomycetes bacterium]|nr:bifunctional folylpolyglutamate synthase/dihydrofolate synthase [Planctomycetota bacterium]
MGRVAVSEVAIRTAEDAEHYLDALVNRERAPAPIRRADLERMARLERALGSPWTRYPSIHVAGTKGKGSTVRIAEALLGAAGVRVGAFLSPHLVHVEERIRIGGEQIGGEAFASAVESVRAAAEPLPEDPSYFEALTGAAMVAFARARVDVGIFEVGLGGRLDATNVIRPDAAVIASIGLEHTKILGPDAASIASEKAGIAKPGVPLIAGPVCRAAREAIRRRATEVGAPLLAWPRAVRIRCRGDRFDVLFDPGDGERIWSDLALAAWGIPQRFNAALALAAVTRIPGAPPIASDLARRVLARLIIPGRLQFIPGRPDVLVDGAHTRESAIALAREVAARFGDRPRVLLVSIAQDKGLPHMMPALARIARSAVTTAVDPARSRDPGALADAFRTAGIRAEAIGDPRAAFDRARDLAGPEGIVCATGSLYLAGEVMRRCGLADG